MPRLPCPPELWPTFSALLDALLELPPEARGAWLDALGPEYAAVKPSLDRVLKDAASLTGEAFERGTGAALGETQFAAGDRIGPYALVRPLGQGGMGEVWLAVRGDGMLKRPIALKLPHAHLLAGAARRRFERERDILSALTHPGIARLYDAGVSEGGHPYLAMELIEGKPVTRYSDDARCGIEERLDLFRQILEAVHYAHMRFIAHRDLKPSNILVTPEAQVKLLDFGIAKLLCEEGSAAAELTRLGDRPLTPDYAAPEQLAGAPVTTVSDIYTLGVVLFVLLTGRVPAPGARGPAAAEAAHGSEAPRASASVADAHLPLCGLDARGLRRALRGDLDAILAMALHPDPARRYQSVPDFAADLARYRAHQPLAARRIGRLRLAAKFLRRHRLGAAVAAVLLVTAGAGVGGIAWQAQRAAREARREAAVKNFLIGVFKASDPRVAADRPRDQITARDLLDIGARRASEGFFGETDTQIELLGTLGEIYYELGDKDRFEALHRRQLELAAAHYGPDNPVATEGLLLEANIASIEGDDARALSLLARADSAIDRAGNPVQRAEWWFYRALALRADPKAGPERRQALERSIALYAQHAPRDGNHAGALGELAFYYYNAEGNLPQAARYFRAAIAASERSDNPDESDQGEFYADLAAMLSFLGDLDGSEAAFRQALDLLRRTYGEGHPNYWVPAANYAQLVHWRGDRLRSLQMFERLRAAMAPKDLSTHEAVVVNEMYAGCLAQEGRAAEAIPTLEAAERHYLEKPEDAADLRRLRLRLGDAYDRVGRSADARRALQSALDDFVSGHAPGNFQVLWARERFGRFLLEQHDLAGAEAQLREVARWTQAHDAGQGYVALANGDLALLALERGDAPAALASIRTAEAGLESLRAAHDVRWGPYLWLIQARVLARSGDAEGARGWARRALEADERYDAPSSSSILEARTLLASLQAPASEARAASR
ncbi:MAG TPA: protein kinase [Steroidobacteraceae bacterium]|nr:protein kinase [Steroidobacteraceae bacterium]